MFPTGAYSGEVQSTFSIEAIKKYFLQIRENLHGQQSLFPAPTTTTIEAYFFVMHESSFPGTNSSSLN
jgi:hypothetical protein